MNNLLNFKLYIKIISLFWIISGSLSFILPTFVGEVINIDTLQRLSLYIVFTTLLTSTLFIIQKQILLYTIVQRVLIYIVLSIVLSWLHMKGYYEIKIILGFDAIPIKQQFVLGYMFSLSFRFLILYTLIELILKEKLDRINQIQRLKLEKENIDSKLHYLSLQLNPHFMFNTLNSISALIETNPTTANESLELFANVYRKVLESSSSSKIKLTEEITFARNYIELMKLRFGNRLIVNENINNKDVNCFVPPLIIQPLLENSCIHGFKDKLENCEINITIQKENEELVITIQDNGLFGNQSGNGVGISNIKSRLHLLYQNNFFFDLLHDTNGTQTIIKVPYENINS